MTKNTQNENLKIIDDLDPPPATSSLCSCKCDEVSEPHTCPYSEELGGSDELCNCCSYCTSECASDV